MFYSTYVAVEYPEFICLCCGFNKPLSDLFALNKVVDQNSQILIKNRRFLWGLKNDCSS